MTITQMFGFNCDNNCKTKEFLTVHDNIEEAIQEANENNWEVNYDECVCLCPNCKKKSQSQEKKE